MLCTMAFALEPTARGRWAADDAVTAPAGGVTVPGGPGPACDVDSPGRRERKKRATYLALRAAALELVSERGFANVTVEDIAEAVDVSVRTFFNYFSSKEDALVGEDPALREALRAEILALPSEVPLLEALRHVVLGRLRAIAEDLDVSGEDHEVWARRFAAVHAQPEVLVAYAKHLTVVERFLTDALVERLGGDESVRPEVAVVTAAALAVMRTVHQQDGLGGIEAVIERTTAAFDLMAAGFRLPARKGTKPARAKATQATHRMNERSAG